jgi:glycosyltransferase involved in cell wall biosynthesis
VPERHDVVMLYAPPWYAPTRFSKHHLARYLAERGRRVLYVEAPLTPLGLRRGRAFSSDFRDTLQPPRRVAGVDRLWRRRYFLPVPYHAITPLTSLRASNKLGQRLLTPVIRRDLRRLGFRRPIIIAGLPHAVDALPGLARACLVYHCADDYAHVRGFPKSLPRLEAELCRQADLVITTSSTLCEDRRKFNAATYWVPNGADVEHFGQSATPAAELRDLRRPVVGFVGGLSQWVDLQLVANVAAQRQQWTFVLIGPTAIDVSPVHGLENVRLLGPRPYAELPSYLAGMDVGLIPFRAEPVTYHADPIKVYEYLAAGLPVVASDLPALHRLAHVVRLADSPATFLEQLDAAVAEGRSAREHERRTEAARHTWSARFEEVERLIEQACGC